jgi:hypothetical protein
MKTDNRLKTILKNRGLGEMKIKEILDSGYIIRDFGYPPSLSVSDRMYGNKLISGTFEIDKFIEYVNGNYKFEARQFVSFNVKSKTEIDEILSSPDRKHHIENESMSFRGQPKEYKFKRVIPNPVRSDKNGEELSIMPGLYRQVGSIYSFKRAAIENRSFSYVLHELEPKNPSVYLDSYSAYDIMRVEQHYASQTSGLDISFDIDTAIFFATHRSMMNSNKKAFYEKVGKGDHSGVIYCFRFRDPPVKRTQYLIKKFDLFKTYRPVRVIRQNCGLPLIGEYERNIATTDLDCILYLDKNFHWEGGKTPKYMFPNPKVDRFYGKLLELKRRYPAALEKVVEYEIE